MIFGSRGAEGPNSQVDAESLFQILRTWRLPDPTLRKEGRDESSGGEVEVAKELAHPPSAHGSWDRRKGPGSGLAAPAGNGAEKQWAVEARPSGPC